MAQVHSIEAHNAARFLNNRYRSCINTDINEDISQQDFAFMLMEFEDTHGSDALIALCGFYLWCFENIKDHDERMRKIHSTFAHDLSERNEETMLPRSSGYKEYYQKYAY